MKMWNNSFRVDKSCIDAEEMLVQSMEFERVADYSVPENSSLDEGMPENLQQNGAQVSDNAEDGNYSTNCADDKISSAGRPEVIRRRSGCVAKPPERFQNMAMLSFEDPIT